MWLTTLGALTSQQSGIDSAAILAGAECFLDLSDSVQYSPRLNMQWMASDGQQPKHRRVEDAGDANHKEMLIAIAKLSLKNADDVKELQAATFRTIIVPADCDFATAAKDATTAFADRTRGKDGKHDLGEPHVHLWSAVVGVALRSASDDAKTILQTHVDEANSGGPQSLLSKVTYARMKKTFDKKYVRFYFSVHHSIDSVLDVIMSALTKIGGQEKHGTAPRSSLEREVQAKLDAMQ